MRIKKTDDQNEYIRVHNTWVRNFCTHVSPKDINDVVTESDYNLLLENEVKNRSLGHADISTEDLEFSNVVIVSDGFDFKRKHHLLKTLPKEVAVFAVNGALSKWELVEQSPQRAINLYVVNNPYLNCRAYFPKKNRYYPACVASIRTCHDFTKRYQGNLYFYHPVPQHNFGFMSNPEYYVDDYRNPICAAIGLAYRFHVKKLMLFCCDDSFADPRDSATKLQNGLWSYPQQIFAQRLIDANLHWLAHQEDKKVQISSFSSGIEYENASYIKCEQEVSDFFSR